MPRPPGASSKTRRWAWCLLTVGALASSGCATQAVLSSGQPEALALVPFALMFDAFTAGIASAGCGAATYTPNYAMLDWQDPDDWVGDCAGPLMCPSHAHFVCEGRARTCNCWCEVTLPEPIDGCVPATPLAKSNCSNTPKRVAAR